MYDSRCFELKVDWAELLESSLHLHCCLSEAEDGHFALDMLLSLPTDFSLQLSLLPTSSLICPSQCGYGLTVAPSNLPVVSNSSSYFASDHMRRTQLSGKFCNACSNLTLDCQPQPLLSSSHLCASVSTSFCFKPLHTLFPWVPHSGHHTPFYLSGFLPSWGFSLRTPNYHLHKSVFHACPMFWWDTRLTYGIVFSDNTDWTWQFMPVSQVPSKLSSWWDSSSGSSRDRFHAA